MASQKESFQNLEQDPFTHDVITAHNQYRAKHNAPPLKWSSKAAMAAQRWAEQLANQNKLQHGDHEGMGQNLAYMSGKPMTGQEATDIWYNEIKDYDFSNPKFTPGTGHFTQVVWADSTEIGVGRATSGGQTFVVANYYPPGNVRGHFEANVQSSQRDPQQTTKSDRKVVSQKDNNEQEPSAAQAQEPWLDQFAHDVITAHNQYRAKHNAPPLKWSSKAAVAAQRWAEQLVKQNRLQHGDHEGMGQNLAYMSGKPMAGQEATDIWYNEVKDYDFNNPGFTPTTGHFTQVVWAGSTEIGVGRATSGGQTFVVANYYPPGNVRGRFEANVQASQHRPSENDETTQKESTTDHEASQALEAKQDQFTHDVITAHNQYRAKHNAPPLKWSSKAAVAAQRWAEQLANQNKLQHGDHEGMGQNLAYMSGKPMAGQEATDIWYNEVKKYDFNNPKFTPGTGHFTQVVWAGSTEIGIGRATSGGQTFVVANYVPPGNVQGRFKENVQAAAE